MQLQKFPGWIVPVNDPDHHAMQLGVHRVLRAREGLIATGRAHHQGLRDHRPARADPGAVLAGRVAGGNG